MREAFFPYGFVNPLGRSPTFVLPVFMRNGGNSVCKQVVSKDGTVSEFAQIDLGDNFTKLGDHDVSVAVGDLPLLCYLIGENDYILNTEENLIPELRKRINDKVFTSNPAAKMALSRVLADTNAFRQSYQALALGLKTKAPDNFKEWRNISLLLPEIRNWLLSKISFPVAIDIATALAQVEIRGQGNTIQVGLPPLADKIWRDKRKPTKKDG